MKTTTHKEILPKRFSAASRTLRCRFKQIDLDTIEDSIQYARIEFWQQNITKRISDEAKAYNWFLKVARFYLYKELTHAKRLCKLEKASNIQAPCSFDENLESRDLLSILAKRLSREKMLILFNHASGYSLKEIANTEKVSLNAVKQRHSRASRSIRKHREYFLT